MPFLLHPRNHFAHEVHWQDVWSLEKQGDAYSSLGRRHGQKPAIDGPIPYRMKKGRFSTDGKLYDIAPGRWSSDLIVSTRVRDLIREMDPVSHYFIPLELTLKDDSTDTTHFLFVAGDRINGIVAEESDVLPKLIDGKLAYYSVGGSPKIVWDADVILGRAIWVDQYLPTQIVISDELQAVFKKAKFQKYTVTSSSASVGWVKPTVCF